MLNNLRLFYYIYYTILYLIFKILTFNHKNLYTNDKYISDLERNLYDPSLQTIDSLAKALNIDTYFLLKYDETHKDVPNRI